MNAGARLAVYALILAAALGGGAAVGAAVGPIDVGATPTHDSRPTPGADTGHHPAETETTGTNGSGN